MLAALALSTPAKADAALDVLRAYPQLRATAGIASFYDCKKPGQCSRHKITASGEPFGVGAMTCAHRSYAFGARLRVTNRKNNASIICRVNDRGPFVRGRVIDLTPVGARALDFSGLAPVIIERM